MSEPASDLPVQGERPLRRWGRWGCLTILGAAVAVLAGSYFLLAALADRDLRQALAETDRLEPAGWRLADIEANRREVPDEHNAALVCLKVQPLVPGNWPLEHPEPEPEPAPPPREDAEPDAPWFPPPPPAVPPGFETRLGDLPRPMLLDPVLVRELQLNLQAVEPARLEARKLAGLTEGRFPITWDPNYIATTLTSQGARPTINVLRLEAVLHAQENRPAEACDAVRRMLVVCQAIGDEPTLISMLIRIACASVATATLERVLALTEPSPADLADLQKRLEEEAAVPTFLNAVRGERAGLHELMLGLKAGRIKMGALTGGPGPGGAGLLDRLANTAGPALARRAHPRTLRVMNDLVEKARLPVEEQAEALAEHEKRVKQAATEDILVRLLLPAVFKCGEAYRRGQGSLRCAVAALAAERFRREHGRWPKELDELVPRYLAAVPTDPSDGQPLRWRPTSEGVLVYWVGLDGKDDGGAVGARQGAPLGKDQGFRLWDAAQRRQPAREMLTPPAEEGGPRRIDGPGPSPG